MKEFQILLENFWILKKDNKDLYFQIKDSIPALKPFVEENLGWNIIWNKDMIKMEKIPDIVEPWMGINEFSSLEEYAMFSLMLGFLEEKPQGEQFILSEAADFILLNYPQNDYIDWNLYAQRKSFVKILKTLTSFGLISIDSGDEKSFENNLGADVLYHSTGLSSYFMRFSLGEIDVNESINEFGKRKLVDVKEEKEKGVLKRKRIYTNLFLKPAVYGNEIREEDFLYIKNFYHKIESDISRYTDAYFHLSKNCAMIMLENDYYYKDVFPKTKSISDIALIINNQIINMVENQEIFVDKYDNINLEEEKFLEILQIVIKNYKNGWSKEYREMSLNELYKNIINYMSEFMMLEKKYDKIIIKPIAALYKASYSNDFVEGKNE